MIPKNTRDSKHKAIAVIFEVYPNSEQYQEYLDIAEKLRPELELVDGFISVERYSSLTVEGKILSLSFWRDEAAVKKWRQHMEHRNAQSKGRKMIFQDYHLRVAGVIRDYGMFDRADVPVD